MHTFTKLLTKYKIYITVIVSVIAIGALYYYIEQNNGNSKNKNTNPNKTPPSDKKRRTPQLTSPAITQNPIQNTTNLNTAIPPNFLMSLISPGQNNVIAAAANSTQWQTSPVPAITPRTNTALAIVPETAATRYPISTYGNIKVNISGKKAANNTASKQARALQNSSRPTDMLEDLMNDTYKLLKEIEVNTTVSGNTKRLNEKAMTTYSKLLTAYELYLEYVDSCKKANPFAACDAYSKLFDNAYANLLSAEKEGPKGELLAQIIYNNYHNMKNGTFQKLIA